MKSPDRRGSAREGVRQWWLQRLTAIALLPLAALFLPNFASVAGGSWSEATFLYQNPLHALVAILFLAVCAFHLCLGMRVVIEDYVHHAGVRTALLVGNALGCSLLGAAGALSVILIAAGGAG